MEKDARREGRYGLLGAGLHCRGSGVAHLVPKSVYAYLTENHLDERIKRLEQMRLDEKDASLVWSEKKEE